MTDKTNIINKQIAQQSLLKRFHIAIVLMSIVPLLICCYLITVRFYSIEILVGLNGVYFLMAVLFVILGLIVGHYVIRETVDRLVETTAALASAKAELEQLELFSYMASHDLREPLYKIISFGDLLKIHSGALLDEKGRVDLELMQKSAWRMSQMIEELREFAKINKPGAPLETVDLRTAAREAVLDLDLRIKEANGRVEVGELHAVRGDRTQIHRLFQNLIGNAIKFHQKDRPPHVVIQSRATGDQFVEITVRDNGIGFDEKYLDRIFKPFQKLHSISAYEGSGMGLAICQKIVLRHGGAIAAKSVPGQGSTFIVKLPVCKIA